MLAVQIEACGHPEVLRMVELPLPKIGPGEILIKQQAIGVNFVDVQHRQGGPYPSIPLPFVPGIEAAGEIVAVGSNVQGFQPGDRVAYCGPMPGAYAEYTAIAADQVVTIPSDISYVLAATIMMQGMTAHYLTHDAHSVQEGEWVLVHAAASGVGRLVTQYSVKLGANVIGSSRSSERQASIIRAGAQFSVCPMAADFSNLVKEVSGGCHVAYDSLGGTHFLDALKCLRARGELVSFGMASGPVPLFDVARLGGYFDEDIAGSLRISRTSLADFVPDNDALQMRAMAVFSDIQRGVLVPEEAKCLQLDQAGLAHSLLELGGCQKIVLLPGHRCV